MENKILITICARVGSKGIPGKNIKLINNQPLIAYTVSCAKQFEKYYNATIALSTDSLEIKSEAEKLGIFTEYIRPEHLSNDSAGKVDAIRDILFYEENKLNSQFDILLDLDVTSPLRNFSDLKKGYEILTADKDCITLFSVNEANRNPYFNMVEQNEDGYISLSKTSKTGFLTRQSTPKVYDVNASFYFYKRKFFDLNSKTPITDRTKVYVMDHFCFDLDHPVDFEFMEYLIVNNKLDFDLSN